MIPFIKFGVVSFFISDFQRSCSEYSARKRRERACLSLSSDSKNALRYHSCTLSLSMRFENCFFLGKVIELALAK